MVCEPSRKANPEPGRGPRYSVLAPSVPRRPAHPTIKVEGGSCGLEGDMGAFGVDQLPLGPPTTHYQSQGGGLRVRLWGAAQSPHSRSLFGAGGVTPTTTHYRSQGGGLRE